MDTGDLQKQAVAIMAAWVRRLRQLGPARIAVFSIFIAVFWQIPIAYAQIQHGEWTTFFEDKINQLRKTELRVIVLDEADHPVQGATVHVSQLAHSFELGYAIDGRNLANDLNQPPLKVFNSISLEHLSNWSRLQAKPDTQPADDMLLEQALCAALQRGMTIRWGVALSADMGRNPDWLVPLQAQHLQGAIDSHIDRIVRQYCGRLDQVDVYGYLTSHSMVEERLGLPMLRRMFERAKAACPELALGVRFDNGLSGRQGNEVYKKIMAMKELQVHFDYVAIDQKYSGKVSHVRILGGVKRMEHVPAPVYISGLEVGGDNMVEAAINMDTVLRLLFAQANVHGIWFTGLRADELAEPNAALLDDEGGLTAIGNVVERLFGELWWSEHQDVTDELGNVNHHVFAGRYHISAELDGRIINETQLWLPISDQSRVVVLQPYKQEPISPEQGD